VFRGVGGWCLFEKLRSEAEPGANHMVEPLWGELWRGSAGTSAECMLPVLRNRRPRSDPDLCAPGIDPETVSEIRADSGDCRRVPLTVGECLSYVHTAELV